MTFLVGLPTCRPDYKRELNTYLKDNINPVKPQEIILLRFGDNNEGTTALLASSVPPIIRDMNKGMRADEIILDYAQPVNLMDEFLEFMGLDQS